MKPVNDNNFENSVSENKFKHRLNPMAVFQAAAGVCLGVSGVFAQVSGRAQTGFLNATRNGLWAIVHKYAGKWAKNKNEEDVINRRVNAYGTFAAALTNLPQAMQGGVDTFNSGSLNTDIVGGGLAVIAYGTMAVDQNLKFRRLSNYFKNNSDAVHIQLKPGERNKVIGYGLRKAILLSYMPVVLLAGRAVNFTCVGAAKLMNEAANQNDVLQAFVNECNTGNGSKPLMAAAFLTVSGTLFVYGACANLKRKTAGLLAHIKKGHDQDHAPS